MNRFKLIVLAMVGFAALLLFRLVDLQLVRGSFFHDLVDDNRFFSIRIPPERGVFFDRFGQPLSWNKRTYAKVSDKTAIQPTQVAISREEALQLMATDSASVRFSQVREYRFPEAVAHVLGYVGPVTADDLLADTTLHVSDTVGKSGLEKVFDSSLRGRAGEEVYEINSLGIRQRLVSRDEGVAGQSYETTLDPYLSQVSLQALGEQSGAVVILDGDSGEVLSLVSTPSYNSNELSTVYVDQALEKQRRQRLADLLNDPKLVFFNRALAGTYPPGSVFKIVTALGGLEGQALDANTTVLDEGILKVGDFEYANWYFTQFGQTEGEIGLQRAISRSNDIFFYKVAEWLGPVRLAEFARMFGLGEATGLELPGESTGIVPDPEWKERVIGEPWYLGNTFHMGIGQGDILVTPLQIAQMMQAVVNQGELCQPSLMPHGQANCSSLGLTAEHLELVLNGLLDACSSGGTAYPFFPYNEIQREDGQSAQQQLQNGAILCKTGTAEFGGEDERGYRKTHGWLASAVGTSDIRQLAKEVAGGQQETIDQVRDNQLLVEEASEEAELIDQNATGLPSQELDYLEWLRLIDENNFPDKLVIVALVESDEDQPYKEGSRDAGEVVKTILDWMAGEAN